MEGIYFRTTKNNVQEISSNIADNGFLNITVPNSSTIIEVKKWLANIGTEKTEEIVNKQNKNMEAFRKKVKALIDKYVKELDLPFIRLRLQAKTNKLNDFVTWRFMGLVSKVIWKSTQY